jgi:hypothetical protein
VFKYHTKLLTVFLPGIIPLKTITQTKAGITLWAVHHSELLHSFPSLMIAGVCTHFTCSLRLTVHFGMCGWNLVSIVIFSYQSFYRCSPWMFNYFFPDITYRPFCNFFTELLESYIFQTYFVTQHIYIHSSQGREVYSTISLTFCEMNSMPAFGLICPHQFC